MSILTTSHPNIEPVSVAEAKDQLRIDHDDEDVLIKAYIKAARHAVETYIRGRLITQTLTMTVDCFSSKIGIPIWPIQSVTSIKYTDSDGVEATVGPADYRLVKSRKPNFVAPTYLEVWPTARYDFDAVRIEFVAGYGAVGTDVPADINQAVLMMVGEFYENREATLIGASVEELPFGVKALLSPHIFWV